TPADQLEAVSSYARSQGATQGILFYVDRASGTPPEWLTVVAEWVTDPRQEAGIGARFQTLSLPFTQEVLAHTSQMVLFEDLENHPIVDPIMAAIFREHVQHGAAILPIHVKGGLIGILWFTWNQPHRFDQRDERIYSSLIQQATPILESTHLLDQTRWRAAELEAINHEIDSLYQASSRLARARTADELLEAVSDYPRRMGANAGSLTYAIYQDDPDSGWREIVSEWVEPGALAHGVGMRFENSAYSGITEWLKYHDQPWLVADVHTEDGMDQASQQAAADHHIVSEAVLPLRNQGRLVGVLLFGWAAPFTFTERDQRIYTALIQLAAPVIDSVRLLEENHTRAVRAEEAYRESDTLYRASKAINAASTFEDIVRAVEDFDVGAHGIALSIWEHYDFNRAAYFEVMATGRLEDPARVGTRLGPEHFPITRVMPRDYPTFVENIEHDTVDPVSRESWRQRGVHAGIAVPLTLNDRWMGMLAFHSHLPRQYAELEKRLVAGIGALVAAAVDRIRLQQASETSRRRAESLAQISSALSQATDE
ncbi:MAG: GAF domain-containing protein, partial [Anaerolineae bacterium]|nr:GAF domain-containing protein [Anaerolineae bacterium]